jgi:hypothetical protein
MKKYGVDLPAYSDAQYKMGTPVGKADLKPGDLVFFHNSSSGGKTTGHVGLYIGDGKMVNAANPSAGTVVQNVTWGTYVGARRYINTSGSATVPKGTPTSSTTDHAGDSPTVSAQYTGQPPAGQDHLNLNDAVAVQEFNMDFVKSHPAILKVFQQAVDEDWFTTGGAVGKAKFVAAIQATPWAKANGSFAQAWILRSASAPPVVVAEERTAAAQFVRDAALRVGAKLTPEQEAFFANQVLLNGWNADAGRAHFLDQALTGQLELTDPTTAGKSDVFQTDFLNYEGGAAARTMQTLKDSAYKNGLTFSADWYRGAARAVQSGLGNIADYQQEIRTKAASMFPVFSDRVAAGADVMDLASPYINKMASTLGIDPNAITLNDPTIKQAMGGMDAKGNRRLWACGISRGR